MAHTPQLSPEMAGQALDAHCSILVDSTHSKDAERKVYIGKCVEDIKKVTSTPFLVVTSLQPLTVMGVVI